MLGDVGDSLMGHGLAYISGQLQSRDKVILFVEPTSSWKKNCLIEF
jgi:hypothetical protein